MTSREVFGAAVEARDTGDYELAEELLLSISLQDQRFPAYFAALGHVRWELGKLDGAIEAFREAVKLAPNAEEASLGLFHCLWECDRTDEAFDEMRRYLTDNQSQEYATILADINK